MDVTQQVCRQGPRVLNIVIKDWPHQSNKDDAIFHLTCPFFFCSGKILTHIRVVHAKKIYDWCACIGKAGIDAVEAIWASENTNPLRNVKPHQFCIGVWAPHLRVDIYIQDWWYCMDSTGTVFNNGFVPL